MKKHSHAAGISRSFVTHCPECGKRVQHGGLFAVCAYCRRPLSHERQLACPHGCGARIKLDQLAGRSGASECPKCSRPLCGDIPLRAEAKWLGVIVLSLTAWWPASRRRLALREEAARRYQSDYELWSRECRTLEEERQARLEAAAQEDARFGAAVKANAGDGALDYVLARHQRVWNENAARIEGLVRSRYLPLAGQPNTQEQILRGLRAAIPGFIEEVSRAERIEIREGLTLERLARTAPDDHHLFAGRWFWDRFETACEQHLDWRDRNPSSWAEVRDRYEPRERGNAFERYLKGVLEQAGGEMVQITKGSGDYGADLLIVHQGRRIIVQAKSYSEKVGLEAVQEVQAARSVYRAEDAWVITDSEFTPNARALAAENTVYLIDASSLDLVGTRVLGRVPEASAPARELVSTDSQRRPASAEPGVARDLKTPPLRPSALVPRRRTFIVTCAVIGALAVASGMVWVAAGKQKSEERAVMAVIDRWATSTRSLNVEGLLGCYAPRMKRFYSLKDVGFDEVAKNKRDAFRRFSETQLYRLRNVTFEHVDGQEAVIVFDKDWDFRDRRANRHYSGSGRQRLTLDRFGTEWLITGEEELGVHAVTGAVRDKE